jgi:hypothetical protein
VLSSHRNRALAVGLLLVVPLATAGWFWIGPRGSAPPATTESPEKLPEVRPSPFLNTDRGVAFVGAAACVSCHPGAHASYQKTAHSQALAEVDLAVEPPDGEFTDGRSRKTYRITRRDGEMHHTESIQIAAGEEMVLAEFPVRYTIGSGRFSRSYLIEIDGFLYESPATWYTARPGWGLSPGYENYNSGFQRPVELRCLVCHAGRIEPVDNSPQRVEFHALVIDCERCHGPGALHVARWEQTGGTLADGEIDRTIVNPMHLERRLREDICAQCHLHSAATVELRGRRLLDYRPGLWLADYVTHYSLETPKEEMQVVGHAEQMRLSRCHQASDTLTCTTCHDPHAKPAENERMVVYRTKCLGCHDKQACSAPWEARWAGESADNCVACHMPRGDTEIPHFAFTHHRIGIHKRRDALHDSSQASELVALDDVAWQPKLDQERNLGLAYLQHSDAPGQRGHAPRLRSRAQAILEKVHRRNTEDSEVAAALARLSWGRDPVGTIRYARAAAEDPRPSPDAEATICFTLGSTYFVEGPLANAKTWLERTVRLRPTADVWFMLSDCEEHAGDFPGALHAARRAAKLASDRPKYVERLAEMLRRTANTDESETVELRLGLLRQYRRQVDR